MKFLLAIVLFVLSTGCDVDPEAVIFEEVDTESAAQIDSFRIGNTEIREDMLSEFAKNDIEHWINEDGSIGYFLSDGELIDKIGTYVIAAYVSRN